MKIAIFGGSFNPPTLAHMRLANYVADNVVDIVLMMPCYKSLYNKGLVDGLARCHMINESITNPKVKCFDWEIVNEIENKGTYEIMQMLHDEFPEEDLYFVIGMDNSQKVRTWRNGDKIVENMKFIVVPRMGIGVTDKWFTKPPHIFLDKYEEDDISSTLVKKMLLNDENTDKVLDKAVKDYIVKFNLYRD